MKAAALTSVNSLFVCVVVVVIESRFPCRFPNLGLGWVVHSPFPFSPSLGLVWLGLLNVSFWARSGGSCHFIVPGLVCYLFTPAFEITRGLLRLVLVPEFAYWCDPSPAGKVV